MLERHIGGLGADDCDRLALRVDARDLRLEDAVGKIAADLRDGIADVIDRAVGRGAELKLDERRAVAFAHRAAHLVDAVDAADRRFDALGDLCLQFLGGRARLRHRDDRGREIDVRRVVDLHPGEGDQPGERESDEQHDRKDRVADAPRRNVAEVHGLTAFLCLARDA